jgi:hypothetical protein
MAKEVKVVWIRFTGEDHPEGLDPKAIFGAESQDAVLTKLVNEGWVIVTAGGGSERMTGFVVLQKDT